MIDLYEIAEKLEKEEQLKLKYRLPVASGDETEWVTRTDRILDVAEESGILYVDRDGHPAWVKLDEAIEVIPSGSTVS